MNQSGLPAQKHGSILKALLGSTLLKDLIRINMNSSHPDSGRKTVRTLLGEDPEVFFGIIGGLPAIVNNMLGALTEVAVQLKDKYPPELLKSFAASLLDDIDRDEARKCGKAWAELVSAMLQASPELKTLAVRTILTEGPAVKATAVNAFSRFVNGINRDDPQALSRFVSKVFENIDGKELGKASAAMADAFLDQKWHLLYWSWKLAKGRIRKRLKAFG